MMKRKNGMVVSMPSTRYSTSARRIRSMASKLVAHAPTRAEAIERMRRALVEYRVDGIETTIPFFRFIMDHPDFRSANFDTGFIDRVLPQLSLEAAGGHVDAAIAAAAIMAFEESQQIHLPEESESAWKRTARREGLR